jgi:hypothetical protein
MKPALWFSLLLRPNYSPVRLLILLKLLAANQGKGLSLLRQSHRPARGDSTVVQSQGLIDLLTSKGRPGRQALKKRASGLQVLIFYNDFNIHAGSLALLMSKRARVEVLFTWQLFQFFLNN